MALSKNPYKGTRDLFPLQKRIQNYLFDTMKKTAESFGYEPYDGPLLEEVELYKAKSGEELINEQIYSFTDRGNRFVAIRPEMTPTLARMVAQVHREIPKPIRWYAIPNLMRYENPQKGRLREHWQFNCDLFGADETDAALEMLLVLSTLMKNFKADSSMFGILINDRRIVDGLFQNVLKLTAEESYKLYKIIDKSKKVSAEALDKMVGEVIKDENKKIIFKKYLVLTTFDDLRIFLSELELHHENKLFMDFVNNLKILGLDQVVQYDPTIVRGLDYYTGMVFEVFDKHPDNRRAICGGGAYANLLQIFNEDPLPGIGFGLGDVTLTDFLKTHNILPDFAKTDLDLLATFQVEEAKYIVTKLAHNLRENNLKVETHLSAVNFKKVFGVAEKKGCHFLLLMGSDEIETGDIIIKNLKHKTQEKFKINDIQAMIKFIKGSL